MTGAGFGGCTVNLVRPDAVDALRAAVDGDTRRRTGLPPGSCRSTPSTGPAGCAEAGTRLESRPHLQRAGGSDATWRRPSLTRPHASVTSRARAATSRFRDCGILSRMTRRSLLSSHSTESFRPPSTAARPRRRGPARPPSAGSRSSSSCFLAGIGAIAAIAAVGVYNSLAAGPRPPPTDADELRPARGDDHLRPDRQDRAGALRRRQARGRHVRPDPEGPARRDDRGRGQDVLGQRRLRPGRHRLGRRSTRSAATAAARRRSPSSSSASGCSTRRSSRTRTGRPSASSRRSSSRSG